ncbi:Type II secretory pathway component [Idiomarina sp. HP20-50]|uniref:Type II secretory pathway component n=1 Tax=Idiomarina sp. HP20-50 TaxID=3070813 RepID=UPI00294B09D9|nr:Type II secretory pathway component [Idiomarina sp. HP20-50]MDV6315937.1 Type II secretory pathway component [Idiomarina sp. HP20-50]
MTNWWARIEDSFDVMPSRQRSLLVLAGFLLLSLPLVSYVILPTLEESQNLKADNQRIQSQLEQLSNLESELQAQLNEDINAPLKVVINELERRLALRENRFSENDLLLAVAQRKAFLRGVLKYSDELAMEKLEAKVPTAVFETGTITLYQHAVQAQFSGGFFEVLEFVDVLKAQYPTVHWASFSYQVNEYPTATVTIVWYLLSTDKEFISA